MKAVLMRLGVLILAAGTGAVAMQWWVGRASEAEIRRVWMQRERYEGRKVRVSGTLRRFLKGKPREHFALESSDGYRIGVAGEEALIGKELVAVGVVKFSSSTGLGLRDARLNLHE